MTAETAMTLPEGNAVYEGDCLELMSKWPNNIFDHCITDPPFGIASGGGRNGRKGLGWAFSSHVTMQEVWDSFSGDDFFSFNVNWLREVSRVVRPNGNILVFGSYHNIYQIGFILQQVLNLRILNSIVWYKPNAQPNITARTLTESTEYIIWAVNEAPGKATNWRFEYWEAKEIAGGKQMRNLWFPDKDVWTVPVVPPSERKLGRHPSQKPEEITDRLVAIASWPGEILVDPFAGVGTTAVSAMKFGRRYVLIESNHDYAKIARQRVDAFHLSRYVQLFGVGRPMGLTDADKRLLAEVPVPQADDLKLVFDVPGLVLAGNNTRARVAEGLKYASRQGPYYADAAIALGLIRADRTPDQPAEQLSLTEAAEAYVNASSTEQKQLQRTIVLSSPIIKYLAARLDVVPPGEAVPYPVPLASFDVDKIAQVLRDFEISESTARRRAHTLRRWLDAL